MLTLIYVMKDCLQVERITIEKLFEHFKPHTLKYISRSSSQ